jgi:hypothetical protein
MVLSTVAMAAMLPATENEHERDAADEHVWVVELGLGSHVVAAALALSAPPYRGRR